MSNIKLEQYKIFKEAAFTLSFSQAARNLYITQSAVSQTITLLEKELDTSLFIRHRKGVTLTKEGEMLYHKISQALSLITNAENELSSYKQLTSGELTIGAGDSLCEHYLIPYLVSFRERYPQVHIKVINGTTSETIKLLKSGTIDLAFVNMPLNDPSIQVKSCYQVHDIFVSGTKDLHTYSYQEIAKENLILLETLSNSRNFVDNYFSKHGILLKPAMELGAYSLLLKFAQNKLGISCVIKEFSTEALKNEQVYALDVQPPLPARSIGYASLKTAALSAAALKFIALIEE